MTQFTYRLNELWHYNTHEDANNIDRRQPDRTLLQLGTGPDFHPDNFRLKEL